MKTRKTIIFIIVFFFILFMLKSCVLFLPFSISDLRSSKSDIKIPFPEEKNKIEENVPIFNVPNIPVTAEMKNIKLDCTKDKDIWPQYRKEKMLCKNIYNSDIGNIKAELEKTGASRLVFYGRWTIYDCPVSYNIRKMSNPIDGCYDVAKFLDSYLYPKMAGIFQIKIPERRLFIYIEEDIKKVEKICKFPAAGCYHRDQSIVMIPGSLGDQYYPQGKDYRTSWLPKVSAEDKPSYYFYELYPKNCAMNYLELHELTHYFNFYSYGVTPLWFEESMDVITNDEVMKKVCPPGVKYFDVDKYEIKDGSAKHTKMDELNVNDDGFIINMQDKRFENNCQKAIVIQANHLFLSGKMDYIKKFYKILNSKVQYDYYRGITADRLAAAVYESSGNDPAVKNYLYKTSGCPKERN